MTRTAATAATIDTIIDAGLADLGEAIHVDADADEVRYARLQVIVEELSLARYVRDSRGDLRLADTIDAEVAAAVAIKAAWTAIRAAWAAERKNHAENVWAWRSTCFTVEKRALRAAAKGKYKKSLHRAVRDAVADRGDEFFALKRMPSRVGISREITDPWYGATLRAAGVAYNVSLAADSATDGRQPPIWRALSALDAAMAAIPAASGAAAAVEFGSAALSELRG